MQILVKRDSSLELRALTPAQPAAESKISDTMPTATNADPECTATAPQDLFGKWREKCALKTASNATGWPANNVIRAQHNMGQPGSGDGVRSRAVPKLSDLGRCRRLGDNH